MAIIQPRTETGKFLEREPHMPCPFCGMFEANVSVSHTMPNFGGHPEVIGWNVVCEGCGARGPEIAPTRLEAVKMWDERRV